MYIINIHILTFCYDTLNNDHHDLFVGLRWSLGFDFLYRFTSFNLINKIKIFLQSEKLDYFMRFAYWNVEEQDGIMRGFIYEICEICWDIFNRIDLVTIILEI